MVDTHAFSKPELIPVPEFLPRLDRNFRPAVLANRAFERETAESGVPLVIGLERDNGKFSRFETKAFPDQHPDAAANLYIAERLLKFLLWQRGGYKAFIGGPSSVGEYLQKCYSTSGDRRFDYHF